jgi:tetratricopeptide (TPR) repeat protein
MEIYRAKELAAQGLLQEAEEICLQILEHQPNQADALHLMGIIASWTRNYDIALIYLRQSIAIDPNQDQIYLNLGATLFNLGQYDDSEAVIRQVISLNPSLPLAYAWLGLLKRYQQNFEMAEMFFKKAIDLGLTDSHFMQLSNELGIALEAQNKLVEAIDYFEQAYRYDNTNFYAFLSMNLALPSYYMNEEEVYFYRDRFLKGLENIISSIDFQDILTLHSLYDALLYFTPFYIAYQGFNDYLIQRKYGSFIHDVISRVHPQFSNVLPIPKLLSDKRIKVGYVSSYLYQHTISKLTKGWLENHDHSSFEIVC